MQLEARSMKGVCHDGKHLTHEMRVVSLMELSGKVAVGKRLQQILQATECMMSKCWYLSVVSYYLGTSPHIDRIAEVTVVLCLNWGPAGQVQDYSQF